MKVMVTLAKDVFRFGSFDTCWKFERVVADFPLIHELTEESVKAIEAYFDDFVVAVTKLDD
jgi:hypothetical protein